MATSSSPPRISLATSFEARGGAPSDARAVNCYVEKDAEGEIVVQRPGFTLVNQGPTPVVFGGNGLVNWRGNIFYVAEGNIYINGARIYTMTANGIDNLGGLASFAIQTGPAGSNRLLVHDTFSMWVIDDEAGIIATFSTFNPFASGFAALDQTFYAPFNDGVSIRGSNLNDPLTWNPLNVIKALQGTDRITAIYRHLQYVTCFKQSSIEFFWDAGNPTGSPLQLVQGATIPFGCHHAGSIQQFEDCLIWMGTTESGGLNVMKLEGIQPQTISTPAVERALGAFDVGILAFENVVSWSARIRGHRFYCITFKSQISLVYDLSTQKWFQWTFNGGALPFIASCSSPDSVSTMLQHQDGSIYRIDTKAALDNGQPIPVDVYTSPWDGGTRKRKYVQRLEVISDQTGMRNAQLRWTDDDYQTWSNYRDVDLSRNRPFTEDLGTFHRRAFHLHYSAPTPFRARALELTNILLGSE